MRRRVYAESLKRVGELTKFPENAGSWYVCDEYEIREESVFARYPVGPPFKGKDWDWKGWKSYRPLEDVPDLFFKLAYLYEEPDFEEAACTGHIFPGSARRRSERWAFSRCTRRCSTAIGNRLNSFFFASMSKR